MKNSRDITSNYIEREVEIQVNKFLFSPEVIALYGPRQSGKTTLMLKIAQDLSKKIAKDDIVFVNFEDDLEKIRFEKNPKKYIEFYLRGKKKVYFFLDEVKYLKNAGKILKLLFDSYSNAKFIVSGSSSLEIVKLGRYLVGRCLFFELYPFSFAEFLKSKDFNLYSEYQESRFSLEKPRKTSSLFLDRLNTNLKEYLLFGGYPRIVLEPDIENKKVLLRNIFSTYIEKDIVRLYDIRQKENVINLLKYLAVVLGKTINYTDIASSLNISFAKVKELLEILEQTFVIKRVNPFHKNLITELKKNPRYFFVDLGLKNTLINDFRLGGAEFGGLLENYALLALRKYSLNFWRTTAKAEVDFVVKDKNIPIEVKKRAKITRSFTSFLQTYKPSFGVIVNWEQSEVLSKKGSKIFFVPASLL